MEIVRQQISNHPLFGNVKREIVVYDAHISTKFQQIVLEAEVEYFNAETNEKIENTFVSTLPNWVVNNNDFIITLILRENSVVIMLVIWREIDLAGLMFPIKLCLPMPAKCAVYRYAAYYRQKAPKSHRQCRCRFEQRLLPVGRYCCTRVPKCVR